jgi:predicted nicotinamide N-methyase
MSQFASDFIFERFAPLKPLITSPGIWLHQAPDFFRLWDELEKERGEICEIPYWCVVWPGAASLSKFLLNNKNLIKNKSVIDIGCGGGACSIAASLCDASSVTANDIDEEALYAACKNFRVNKVEIQIDKTNYLHKHESFFYDIVIVSDMFYERSTAPAMLEFLNKCKTTGSKVLISDAGRPFIPKDGLEFLSSEIIEVNTPLEGIDRREVRIFNLL